MRKKSLSRPSFLFLVVAGLAIFFPSSSEAEVTLFSEGFESGNLDQFTLIYNESGPAPFVQSGNANSGDYSVLFPWGPQGVFLDSWLVLPPLDTTGSDGLTLKFFESQVDWASFGGEHQILVSASGPADPGAFTPVESWTPANHPISEGWQLVEVNLDAFAGLPTVFIAFRYQGEWADDWSIDDVEVSQPLANDVGVSDLVVPELPVFPENPFPCQVLVTNHGSTPTAPGDLVRINFYRIGEVISSQDVDISGMDPGETRMVDFFGSLPSVTLYLCSVEVIKENDENTLNDYWIEEVYTSQGQRAPFGRLVLNYEDPASLQAKAAFDALLEDNGDDFVLIEVHAPGPNTDPFYEANTLHNEWLRDMPPGIFGSEPPDFVAENVLSQADLQSPGGSDWSTLPAAWLAASQSAAAPLTLSTEMDWQEEPSSGQLLVTVDIQQELDPDFTYILYGALLEDDADGLGYNRTLRLLLPGVSGVEIDPTLGPSEYILDVFLDSAWVPQNMSVATWVIQRDPVFIDQFNLVMNSSSLALVQGVTPVGDEPEVAELPRQTRLVGNTPNPFNPSTVIAYELAGTTKVHLDVFDLSGRLVRRLVAGAVQTAGRQEVSWFGRDDAGRQVASGTYFYLLQAGEYRETRSMVLVK